MTSERKSRAFNKAFYCPCCGYKGLGQNPYADLPPPPFGDLGEPPYDDRFGCYSHEGCHCCGYQFGYDDDIGACGQAISLADYRTFWIKDGCRWFHGNDPRPKNWSIAAQLAEAGIPFEKRVDIRKSI